MNCNDKYFFIVLVVLYLTGCVTSSCVFDDIQQSNVPVTTQAYQDHSVDDVTKNIRNGQTRNKRDINLYKPIRVHVHYLRLDEELTKLEEQERLRKLVSLAVDKVTSILSGM